MFEKRVLGGKSYPLLVEIVGAWRKLNFKGHQNLYFSPHITVVIKSRAMKKGD
jgi:hypothetical protein